MNRSLIIRVRVLCYFYFLFLLNSPALKADNHNCTTFLVDTCVVPLSCYAQVNVGINENCHSLMQASNFLIGNNYCNSDNFTVQLQTSGGTILPDSYITENQVGYTLKATIINNTTGSRCQSTLSVSDLIAPTIQAPRDIVVNCNEIGQNGAPLPTLSGEPTILKECALPTKYFYSDTNFDINCGTLTNTPPTGFPTNVIFNASMAQYAKRIIVRTFNVSDRYNNTATTQQVIYVRARLLVELTMPSTIYLNCGTERTEPTDTVVNGTTIRGTGVPSFQNNRDLKDTYCSIYTNYTDVKTQNVATNTQIIQRNWVVASGCSNDYRNWIQTINIRDVPPTVTLYQNKVFQIPVIHLLTVTASELVSNLSDDCTTKDKMVYGIRVSGTGTGFPTQTSLSFDCNLTGTFTVDLWVKDEGKNTVTTTTTFSVNSDGAKCPSLSGAVSREDFMPVPAKIMLLNGTNDSLNTTIGSNYLFKDLYANNRFRVMPTRPNTDWNNGITMFDVALMSRHILGIDPFTSPYRSIAADVNHSNDIDAVDMLLIQRLVLRKISTFPNNNSWRFILKNYSFDDPTNPFASDFPESLFVPALTTPIENGDFVAVKIGDINSSAGALNISNNMQPFELLMDDKVLEKNKTYRIPIRIMPYQKDYTGNSISALQFALNIDKKMAQIDRFDMGDLPNCNENNFGLFKNEGIVNGAWIRPPNQKFIEKDSFILFNLTLKMSETRLLSQILSINPDFTEGVAFDEIGKGAAVKLNFNNKNIQFKKPTLLPFPLNIAAMNSFKSPFFKPIAQIIAIR